MTATSKFKTCVKAQSRLAETAPVAATLGYLDFESLYAEIKDEPDFGDNYLDTDLTRVLTAVGIPHFFFGGLLIMRACVRERGIYCI
jgi:hypothetical protein